MAGEMTAKAAAAYVTLLAGASLEAVVQLAEDLRKVGAAYPLVVAVLPDVPESHREILVSHGCIVREVAPVYLPPENPTNQLAMATGYVVYYSKIRVWELVEYERMVYLDAGIRVMENIDKLFELEKGHFYFYAAAEHGPPPASSLYPNAGIMFVHEPCLATAELLLDAFRVIPPESFTKQGCFLSMFFMDQYKPIPLKCIKVIRTMAITHPDEDGQLDGAKRPWTEKPPPPFASRLATMATALARENLPAVAILAASSATLGVVIAGASSPVISFGFYAAFIAAIATFMVSII